MKLTHRQRMVLGMLAVRPESPSQLGVRADVLWRLEERGLVRGGSGVEERRRKYAITTKGREALEGEAR